MSDNLLTATPDAAAADGKPAGLPDKFWDAKAQIIRTDALVASYLALEKKLGGMLPSPQNDDDRKRLYKALGVPDKADDYSIAVKGDLFDIDPELNQRLHAKGFTAEQVQEVYDLAAEKMVPLILEMAAEFNADREVERLVKEFGGADRWKDVSRQLLAFGQKNLPPDVLEGLSGSYEGVMALHKMMKADAPPVAVKGAGAGENDDLQAMMKNPKYWRDKDPAYIAKVTAGFEKLYGQKS